MTAVRTAVAPARTATRSARRPPTPRTPQKSVQKSVQKSAPKSAQTGRNAARSNARGAATGTAKAPTSRQATQPRAASGRPGSGRSTSPRPASHKARTTKPAASKVRLTVHSKRFVSLRSLVWLLAVTAFSVLLLSVMIQSLRIEGQSHLDKTSNRIGIENARSLDLRAAVAERESPERIMSEARKLGMIDPGPVAPLASGTPASGVSDSQNGPQLEGSVAQSAESEGVRP